MENPMFGLSGEYRMPKERYRYQKREEGSVIDGKTG